MKFLFLLLFLSLQSMAGTRYVDRPFPLFNGLCPIEVSELLAKPICTEGVITTTCYREYYDGTIVKITVNMTGFKAIKEVTQERIVDTKGTVKSLRFTEITFFDRSDPYVVVESREIINDKLTKCGGK